MLVTWRIWKSSKRQQSFKPARTTWLTEGRQMPWIRARHLFNGGAARCSTMAVRMAVGKRRLSEGEQTQVGIMGSEQCLLSLSASRGGKKKIWLVALTIMCLFAFHCRITDLRHILRLSEKFMHTGKKVKPHQQHAKQEVNVKALVFQPLKSTFGRPQPAPQERTSHAGRQKRIASVPLWTLLLASLTLKRTWPCLISRLCLKKLRTLVRQKLCGRSPRSTGVMRMSCSQDQPFTSRFQWVAAPRNMWRTQGWLCHA